MDSVQLPVDDAPAVSDAGCTSAILLLNMQGMSPAANSTSRWKIPAVSESLLNDKNTHVPFMCITESWLKGYITKAQVKIENYESVRADREIRSRGGALIYVRDNLVISNELIYDNGICEAAATCIDTLRAVVVCIYRPQTPHKGVLLSFYRAYRSTSMHVIHHIRSMLPVILTFHLSIGKALKLKILMAKKNLGVPLIYSTLLLGISLARLLQCLPAKPPLSILCWLVTLS